MGETNENCDPSGKGTRREQLEMRYFKYSIAGVAVTVAFLILNFCFDHLWVKPEPPSAGDDSAYVAADAEGDVNAASGAASGDGSAAASAAAGEGSMVSNAASTGDGSTAVNKSAGRDYYDLGGMGAASQEPAYKPQNFEDYDKGVAWSADLIEGGEEEEALTFLLEFLQIEDLDEQTEATVKYNCGICCLRMGNCHQAITYLTDAAGVSRSPHAYYNLGCAYLDNGEYPNAVEALETALELSGAPGSTVTSEEQERFREALEEAKRQTDPAVEG